jgi:hypothetical protein
MLKKIIAITAVALITIGIVACKPAATDNSAAAPAAAADSSTSANSSSNS